MCTSSTKEHSGQETYGQLGSVSVVIPVFNEAAFVRENLQQIASTLNHIDQYRFNLIVVDDGSTDHTRSELLAYQQVEPRLRVLGLSRNFGKEAAILAGLNAAQETSATIVMDSDLQHPPQLIGAMLKLWRQGFPVVEAVKTHRGQESWLSRQLARGFYRAFSSSCGLNLEGHTDFKLLDQRVVSNYLALPERDRFFRGLVRWLGFMSAQIPFEVPLSTGRNSRWNRWRLWRYAISAITAFSARPLQLISIAGVLSMLLGLAVGTKVLVDLLSGHALAGFTTVILLQLILGGAIMLSLGLIGIYMGQLHDEIKARPAYILDMDEAGGSSVQNQQKI